MFCVCWCLVYIMRTIPVTSNFEQEATLVSNYLTKQHLQYLNVCYILRFKKCSCFLYACCAWSNESRANEWWAWQYAHTHTRIHAQTHSHNTSEYIRAYRQTYTHTPPHVHRVWASITRSVTRKKTAGEEEGTGGVHINITARITTTRWGVGCQIHGSKLIHFLRVNVSFKWSKRVK